MFGGEIGRRLLRALVCVAGVALLAAVAEAGTPGRLRSPVISPGGGHHDLNAVVTVNIRCEANAGIVYTLDGTLPSETNGEYVDRNSVTFILPPGDVTVRAVAIRGGYERSPIRTARFTRSDMSAKVRTE